MGSLKHATDAVDRAVARGYKSAQLQRAVRAAALGLSVALASLALLLLAGTSWLPASLLWFGIVGGVAAAAANWRMSHVSSYDVACLLDREWKSNDQVSTAFYFSGGSHENSETVRAQRELAVSAAARHDAAEALPLKPTRAVWAAAALLLVVVALTGLRYRVAPTLALESALTPALLSGEVQAERQPGAQSDLEQNAKPAPNDQAARFGEELAEAREPAESFASPFDPMLANSEEESVAAAEAEGLDAAANAGDELDFEQSGERSDNPGAEQDSAADEQGSNLQRPGDSPQQADADSSWSEKSNSLLDRLKDALKQLRQNMSSEPSQASAQEGASAAEEGSDSAESPQSGEQAGEQAAEGEGAAAEASMEAGEEPQDGVQQASQGSGSKSGAGSEGEGDSAGAAGDGDGSKQIQQQQAQEAAFEALEEFYLQRAEKLSGDVLVETNSSEISAAATPYQPRQNGRREGAGVAVRDEAPAAYRTFVENYFKEIRSKQE